MKNDLRNYCLKHSQNALLKQWDKERNGTLTPDAVSSGSHKRAWWKCEKGHQWEAEIRTRVCGSGCPVCANRKLLSGENDLATLHPNLAAQWHPAKNGTTMPGNVTPGSRKKVWWQCEKGHEWQASICSRSGSGTGCPVCSGKVVIPGENDLASTIPEIAAEWHPSKNGTLTPQDVTVYSNRRVWWQCPLGHEWQTSVSHRTKEASGCPYCTGRKVLPGFNDLETRAPSVAAQWHLELNGELTPRMVTCGSHKKVWWQCPNGHVWKAAIYSRTGSCEHGCPVCAGKNQGNRLKRYDAILAETLVEHSEYCI